MRIADTFGELAAVYLEKHAKRRKRTWREDERILQRELLPRWRNRKAKGISRRDVREVATALAEHHGIDCRPMTSHGLNGLRISLSIFNTEDEIDLLVTALRGFAAPATA